MTEKVRIPSSSKIKENVSQNCKESNVPSYPDICRQRYREMNLKYDKQFRNELENLERMQPNALEAMRFHRYFAFTTLWPPLHTRREIEWTIKYFQDPLTARERRRLEKIISDRKYSWLGN